jgi:hypothetical protein
MKIPTACYGRYRDVRARMRTLVKKLHQGARIEGALGAELLDTATTPGLLVLHGPSPLLGGEHAFQLYLPHFIIRKAVLKSELPDGIARQVFGDSLQSAWSLLGLLSEPNQGWLSAQEDCLRAVDATRALWSEMDAVGPRYTTGLPAGQRLWDAKGNLARLLVCAGIAPELIRGEAPPGGFPELLRRRTD